MSMGQAGAQFDLIWHVIVNTWLLSVTGIQITWCILAFFYRDGAVLQLEQARLPRLLRRV